MTDSDDDQMLEVTIRVSNAELWWAIRHINDWIAEQPINTEPHAHRFVSALSNPVHERVTD